MDSLKLGDKFIKCWSDGSSAIIGKLSEISNDARMVCIDWEYESLFVTQEIDVNPNEILLSLKKEYNISMI